MWHFWNTPKLVFGADIPDRERRSPAHRQVADLRVAYSKTEFLSIPTINGYAHLRREFAPVSEFGAYRLRSALCPKSSRFGEASGRAGLIGYEVIFRDGQKVFLERRLPNAEAAADWLRSHCRP
jgi:hypothetical protein